MRGLTLRQKFSSHTGRRNVGLKARETCGCWLSVRLINVAEKRKIENSAGKAEAPEPGVIPRILTVGHSTRSIEEFIALLKAHQVSKVVDVRTIPRSRRNPQFNQDALPASLKSAGIGYVHLPDLGGLRHAKRDSINTGWRNASFRGYADYMRTPEFEQGLARLIELAAKGRIAVMCAEAVPWRCHRSLIADALLVRGIPSEDISSRTRLQPHTLTPFAQVHGQRIIYPPESKRAKKTQSPGKLGKTGVGAARLMQTKPARTSKSRRQAESRIQRLHVG